MQLSQGDIKTYEMMLSLNTLLTIILQVSEWPALKVALLQFILSCGIAGNSNRRRDHILTESS